MRLHDLVHTERLRLSVVHAPVGALDREVTGGYITDLPDPARFLSVGDVVLTSGMWFGPEGAAERFIDALVRQRVVALVMGLVHVGHVPDEILDLCRREGLALLTISDAVSFKDVVTTVAAAQTGDLDGIAGKALRFNRRLAEGLARGEGPDAVVRDFQIEFAVRCWVIDAIGTVIAVSGAAPNREEVGRVWNAMLGQTSRDGVVVPEAPGAWTGREPHVHTCWPIVSADGEVTGTFVCEGDQRLLARNAPLVVGSALGALRVDLDFAARWRERGDAEVSELVRVIADDVVSPGEISARMRLAGLDPQQPMAIAVAAVADERFPAAVVLQMATRLFSREGVSVIGAVVGAQAVLLLGGAGLDDVGAEPLAEAVEECLPLLGGRQLRVGVSDPRSGVGGLAAAFATARERLTQVQSAAPVAIAASGELRTHRAVLGQLSERARAEFARDVLRPLVEYDARQGADLVATLRVFLANSGAWQESARQLHLHTNTLRYRMTRIEELTGRSMATMEDRVDFFLALQITDD